MARSLTVNDSVQNGSKANYSIWTQIGRYLRMSNFLSLQIFTNFPTNRFGTDIVGVDNRTMIRRKVAARAEQHQHPNTPNNNPPPLPPCLESVEVYPHNRMSSGVSRSLRRGELVDGQLWRDMHDFRKRVSSNTPSTRRPLHSHVEKSWRLYSAHQHPFHCWEWT